MRRYDRYRASMNRLKPRERELVIRASGGAVDGSEQIAESFGFNTVDGARMAVHRALQRLGAAMGRNIDER